nr:tRNA threonylcarbamoyladenosine dehydratase [Bacilli bacterium]
MLHRFSRTELVIGIEGLAKLRDKTVAIIGVGGVGSFAVEALARSGIGRLILIDKDVVDITNINRQLPALTSTVGQSKVEVMRARIADINPDATVITKQIFFQKDTSEELFALAPDYIVDAMDTISAKIDLIETCVLRSVPVVASMGAANKLDPTQFRVMDIKDTTVDPIARVVRRELRKRGITRGVKVVCSLETPMTPNEEVRQQIVTPSESDERPRKATNPPASIAFVPPVAGMILASVAVRDLLNL